ncbi:TPA: glycosyltransferase family 4 protein [Streptococcus suis]
MKKHILVVSQYFYPEQFRINDICKDLIDRGYKVTVLTGIPNYPEGKYYKGYSFFSSNEEYQGIDIIRIPIIPRGKNKVNLMLNYISFVFSGYIWKLFSKVNPDIIFIYEVSPMTQALPGIWHGKKKRVPVLLYVLDLWPENLQIVGGINQKHILNLVDKMAVYIYKNVDMILTSSRSFISIITSKGIERDKIRFWPQYAEEFYRPIQVTQQNEIPVDNILNLTFAGNIGKAQGLEILPRTASYLQMTGLRVRFNIIGDGRYKDELLNEIEQANVKDYFNFIPRKDAKEIPFYFANSDASIITLSQNELFKMTIPAKLQSTMACGIPIIGSFDGEAATIVKTSESGLVSQSGNAEELAENIIKFSKLSTNQRKQLGENGLSYFQSYYRKSHLMNELDKIFKKI